MELRPYQSDIIADIRAQWAAGAHNVLAVLPTGGGKTFTFGTILRDHVGASCAIAHRRELVGQMSVALARLGVRHRIIAPKGTIAEIVTRHMNEIGRSYYDPGAQCAVAGVDTLLNRDLGAWAALVSLWVCDEGAHLLRANKWGKALARFPNARGLAVTAIPLRADGQGLGRHADGVIDRMVVGPSPRDLMDLGWLCDYRIFAPKSDINLAAVPLSQATGDYSQPALRAAAEASHITGDIIEHYLRIAKGKLGVTFCVSVELAEQTAARFRAAGVPAEMVCADTPELVRAEILRRFARRDILQLVNVDLFGEGFDLPAVEVVSMGRPTESFSLYGQQFGRALRPMPGKPHAIIIDHAGNVLRHGLPDAPRVWSLDRRERKARGTPDDTIPLRACPQCTAVYERFRSVCPHCGYVPVPISRAAPEHVDGDLFEMDAAFLAKLRMQADLLHSAPRIPYGATPVVAASIHKRHREWIATQGALRDSIAWWAGLNQSAGRSDAEGYRRFYHQFGVDVATAQTLGSADATELTARVRAALDAAGITRGTTA